MCLVIRPFIHPPIDASTHSLIHPLIYLSIHIPTYTLTDGVFSLLVFLELGIDCVFSPIEGAISFLAILASSSSEEMEAELQERVESSRKQASSVVEVYQSWRSTVEQLSKDLQSGTGERCIVGNGVPCYSLNKTGTGTGQSNTLV